MPKRKTPPFFKFRLRQYRREDVHTRDEDCADTFHSLENIFHALRKLYPICGR